MDISINDRNTLEQIILSHYFHTFKNDDDFEELCKLTAILKLATNRSSGEFSEFLNKIFLVVKDNGIQKYDETIYSKNVDNISSLIAEYIDKIIIPS